VPFETFTLRQRPDLEEQVHRLNGESWPTFLLHGDITHWESLLDQELADFFRQVQQEDAQRAQPQAKSLLDQR
jgi:hypothetical protein